MQSARPGSLLVIFLTVFIDLLGFGMVLPLLPNYAAQFSSDESGITIGLLMASFSAMQFLFAPAWGRLSDHIGRRPVLMVGLAGSVVFYALFGVATVMKSLPWLFVTRIGAGISGATISTAQAYIADTTTLEARHKGMALIGAAFGLGFTFGPLLAYLALFWSTDGLGPGPGFAASALSAVALVLAYFKLPESLTPEITPVRRRLFDMQALVVAVRTPSLGSILVTMFICVVAFGMFETTISMLVKGNTRSPKFDFSHEQVCLLFSYIGFSLALAQGVLVRRLSGRVHEVAMASLGALTQIVGFWLMTYAANSGDLTWLMVALTVVVCGFALLQPSLNALISRRSDPRKQGGILGVNQSLSALARIIGPVIGVPLIKQDVDWPYEAAAAMMSVGFVLLLVAARRGRDFAVPTDAQVTGAEIQ